MEERRESFEEIMSRIGKGLDTHTVFGEPQQVDGSAVIPVAKISYGGGGGFGGGGPGGKPGTPLHETEGEAAPGGEGMGVGFGISAEPLGVVRVSHDTIEWVPIVDSSRLMAIWSIVGGLALLVVLRGLFGRR